MSSRSELRVLLVDDDDDDFVMIREMLGEVVGTKYALDWSPSYKEATAQLSRKAHDVYLYDERLGEKTGLDLMKEAMASGIRAPLILLTGHGDHALDHEAMRHGASDYLVKSQLSAPLLERTIRYAVHRKEMEAQIMVQDRMASIGLLASSLAHEIGTPLGVIRGRAEYLGIQVGENEAVRKNVDIIIAQIDRVSKLIRSLLNLARGEASAGAGTVHLEKVVSDVMDLVGHEFRKAGVALELSLPVGQAIEVTADAEYLHQVVLNLMVNSLHAIEAAKKAGRTTGHAVQVAVAERGRNWELRVSDTGCGISKENLRNLFKPFFTTKDIGVGTGLGLANSYRIVEAAGGSIQVESEEGKGATFRILLPLSRSSSPDRSPARSG
jgi:signal transduction histidine kinase